MALNLKFPYMVNGKTTGHEKMCQMLTTIRNASRRRSSVTVVDRNYVCLDIAKIMQREGYIDGFFDDTTNRKIAIKLRYHGQKMDPVIHGIKPVSKPSRRVEAAHPIPTCLHGLGTVVVRTPDFGIVTDKDARYYETPGEILCEIW